MTFRDYLASGKYLIFDGAMGTMLQQAGLKPGEKPEDWNLTHPEELLKIHRAYVEAGSDVVSANTFGANSRKYGAPVADTIEAAINIARKSGAKFVAYDMGPTGTMLRPMGSFEFDDAYELFKEQVIAADRAGADLILIETMTDLQETRAAVLAAKENSALPVIASMSFEKSGRTFMGTPAAVAATVLSGLRVDALGVNCSLGPDDLEEVVRQLVTYSEVPVIVQANAGIPSNVDGKTVFNVTPEQYIRGVRRLIETSREAGLDKIQFLGGCCGTNPEFIRLLRQMVEENDGECKGCTYWNNVQQGKELSEAAKLNSHALVCSALRMVDYDGRTAIVGERLNPTGKKKISAALRERNFDLLVSEALHEEECGAQILDVNAGLPDIDEGEVLEELIYAIEGACPLPLQIDTGDKNALERAVRHYCGKPIINSVNGKSESLDTVLPIAAKYGAAVVCLTLDENGIPSKAEERIEIARRIAERAERLGIPRKNLIIDGLVMTVSTNQAEAVETLKTVRLAREELGLHTCLGVSNISFGLPERELVNATFLAAAFTNGLNLPIMDPTKERYMQTVYSFRVLNGEDIGAAGYIEYAQAHPAAVAPAPAAKDSSASAADVNVNARQFKNATDYIVAGNKLGIEEFTAELLKTREAMDIINNEFIPALDKVGELYESGKIFLPQLMSSAETAGRGFDVIKRASRAGEAKQKRMKIVIATVHGDIHDIGKNIVRMLLENYGFEVIDLGKDVPAEKIVETVRNGKIRLVGLSALMTTTVKSMEETITLLRRECPECKIMVGGAVLTKEYADKIGADYYASDAAASAKIAAEVEKNDTL